MPKSRYVVNDQFRLVLFWGTVHNDCHEKVCLAAKAGSPQFKRGLNRRRFGKEIMKKTWPVFLALLLLATPAAVQTKYLYTTNAGAIPFILPSAVFPRRNTP
jgi:hypothetical protein